MWKGRAAANVSVTVAEADSAQSKFGHKCDFCSRKFKTRKGILIHRDSCVHQYDTTEEVYEVEEIIVIGAFGWEETRWILVKFERYDESE